MTDTSTSTDLFLADRPDWSGLELLDTGSPSRRTRPMLASSAVTVLSTAAAGVLAVAVLALGIATITGSSAPAPIPVGSTVVLPDHAGGVDVIERRAVVPLSGGPDVAERRGLLGRH